jgi:hypothetical protein
MCSSGKPRWDENTLHARQENQGDYGLVHIVLDLAHLFVHA